MKAKLIVFAFLLTVLSIVTISIAIKSCQFSPKPNQKEVYEIIVKTKSDSVAVAAATMPDSAKLRKLAALKRRIAEARYNDSIQRAEHK